MTYELTDEILYDIRDGVGTFEVDGEIFEYHTEADGGMDDNGKWRFEIWKRKSDGSFFEVQLGWVRYGYEDYGFETFACSNEMYQVELAETVTYEWKPVKEAK